MLTTLLAARNAGRSLARRRRHEPNSAALTEAELAVLRAPRSPKTQRAIAQELSVSINTVKTHTSAIYRKLAVGSRRRDNPRNGTGPAVDTLLTPGDSVPKHARGAGATRAPSWREMSRCHPLASTHSKDGCPGAGRCYDNAQLQQDRQERERLCQSSPVPRIPAASSRHSAAALVHRPARTTLSTSA